MNNRRTRYEARIDKRAAVNEAEKQGIVADSMDVRMQLLARVQKGEITMDQCQEELRSIKRKAKKNGLVTRQQAFSRG